MEKKKIYIIFTYDIHPVGGTQTYTAGKAKYLQENGWNVYIFFSAPNVGQSAIPYLTQYIKTGGGFSFLSIPPYKLKLFEQDYCINLMINRLNLSNSDDYEIIIESHYDIGGYWAELLAARIKARHIFVCCNEVYRDEIPGKYYEDNLDFFYFKWQRNELAYSKKNMLVRLFNGYKNITAAKYDMPKIVRDPDAVQDVDFPLDAIQKLDWNICHIGRIVKDYVPYAIEGVAELARRHPDKKINFIFVGDVTPRRDFIMNTFKNIDNVQLTALGDMVPIPRILFSKIDVILAIAGAARHASQEGVFLINGSAKNPEKTPGVLGYDTKDNVYGEGTFSYVEALENVLVKKLYDKRNFDYPKQKPTEWYYNNFWTIVEKAAPKKEYYVERLSQERIRDWTAIFPFGSISKGARIILFGATEIAKDYKKQIQSQQNSKIEFGRNYIKQNYNTPPHYEIVAILDEHPENFDNAVKGVERLKQKDYDVIVITTFPQQTQAAADKIVKIVPEMSNRIIYNFKILQT